MVNCDNALSPRKKAELYLLRVLKLTCEIFWSATTIWRWWMFLLCVRMLFFQMTTCHLEKQLWVFKKQPQTMYLTGIQVNFSSVLCNRCHFEHHSIQFCSCAIVAVRFAFILTVNALVTSIDINSVIFVSLLSFLCHQNTLSFEEEKEKCQLLGRILKKVVIFYFKNLHRKRQQSGPSFCIAFWNIGNVCMKKGQVRIISLQPFSLQK